MAKYPSKGVSLWNETVPSRQPYPPLTKNLQIDVAVIGAGIVGLTTAYLLKKSGKNVAVFEKSEIGEGITGFTTGKVTSQHGLIYSGLIQKFGKEIAQLYGEANQAAIEKIQEIITTEQIDCEWRREDNYVFTEKAEEIDQLRQEASDSASLGLPASFELSSDLSPSIKATVHFKNQATFHVVKYLRGLAEAIHGEGSFVFEHTKATHVKDGAQVHFATPQGEVVANDVIFATNVPAPLKDHAAYGLFAYPTRSYIVAGKIDAAHSLKHMYINSGKPTRSILPTTIDGERWLLVGGQSHFVGMSGPAAHRYQKLEDYARQLGVSDVQYRWLTWDFTTYDGLPMAGKLYPHSQHLYVATGLRKWGLTNGTAMAMILTDKINGIPNSWSPAFRSHRSSAFKSMPKGIIKAVGWNK